MFKKFNLNIKEYINSSPKFDKVEWWNLPDSVYVQLKKFPYDIKKFGEQVKVARLKESKQRKHITENIIKIKKEIKGNKQFKVNFPIYLKNKNYVRIYSLMISEGYCGSEFSLHVPEKEFHAIFKDCIGSLISKEATDFIRYDYNRDFLRSRAPAVLKYLIPLPSQIPCIIMKNKDFAIEYLRVAFEAEGSPIYNKKQHKRYIKLSRYTDVTSFVSNEYLPLKKRIYSNALKKKYLALFEKIKDKPPKILQGEQILLKYHFNIDSRLTLEAIRKNKTDLKCGKITARWVLLIYANNINKFIENIGFISKKKKGICKKMMKLKPYRPQYSTLYIIKRIQKNSIFSTKDFCKEMKELGYKSPRAYLWRYEKSKLIRRIARGRYKIIY